MRVIRRLRRVRWRRTPSVLLLNLRRPFTRVPGGLAFLSASAAPGGWGLGHATLGAGVLQGARLPGPSTLCRRAPAALTGSIRGTPCERCRGGAPGTGRPLIPSTAEAARSGVNGAGKWETCSPTQPLHQGRGRPTRQPPRFPSPRELSTWWAALPIGAARQRQDTNKTRTRQHFAYKTRGSLFSVLFSYRNIEMPPMVGGGFPYSPALVGVSDAGIARQQDRPTAVAVNDYAAEAYVYCPCLAGCLGRRLRGEPCLTEQDRRPPRAAWTSLDARPPRFAPNPGRSGPNP
ncbi:hypothetical protein Pla175_38830 [Pirellulimonas nuda]|uniref:Uncharacterized protein n=1 Tax=Pirellulimonas nuda TaxID=2528009 RepID=A0A518DG77_9BACT|nr:hypothetical protein Pla175_38830 [Pirellulimonas nuda]